MKRLAREFAHQVSGIRKYHNKMTAQFASGKKRRKILELGSGKKVRNSYYYSMQKYFDESSEFLQTDVVK